MKVFSDFLRLLSLKIYFSKLLDEIRQDIEDVLIRMKPWKHESRESEVVWGGWAKMALPIAGARIVEVGKPALGYRAPTDVKMDITINLPKRMDLRMDWEGKNCCFG